MILKVCGSGTTKPFKFTFDSTTSLASLCSEITEKTGASSYALYTGFPPKQLSGKGNDTLVDLHISNGDAITVRDDAGYPIEKGDAPITSVFTTTTTTTTPSEPMRMVRHIIAADNSCLFNAIAFCLESPNFDAQRYRLDISGAVLTDSETYNEAFLGKLPVEYAQWIQDSEKWGGEIEMSILSKKLRVEIVAVDVQTSVLYKYDGNPEDADVSQRIYVIYDGIHYDAVVTGEGQRIFFPALEEDGKSSEAGCLVLARQLKEERQFTDMTGFDLKCLVCSKPLVGQKGAQEHAKETGHMNFAEYTG